MVAHHPIFAFSPQEYGPKILSMVAGLGLALIQFLISLIIAAVLLAKAESCKRLDHFHGSPNVLGGESWGKRDSQFSFFKFFRKRLYATYGRIRKERSGNDQENQCQEGQQCGCKLFPVARATATLW